MWQLQFSVKLRCCELVSDIFKQIYLFVLEPGDPSCSEAKYQSTNNSITILGGSISAKGVESYNVWELKNPEAAQLIPRNEDKTFQNLKTSTDYEFVVQSKSPYGKFSIGTCNISTTTSMFLFLYFMFSGNSDLSDSPNILIKGCAVDFILNNHTN